MNATEPKVDTKQRILDSAERLFADRGFEATSLRTIIADAKVNLAAIHYHYRSKEALLDAVILRRLEPVNRERLELLDACERAAVNGQPSLEAVLEAFLAPAFRVGSDPARRSFVRLIGRVLSDSSLFRHIFKQHLTVVVERFSLALHNAVPELPMAEVFWRMHFVAGSMAHTLLSYGQDLEQFHGALSNNSDVEGTIRRLISFAAAGFRAPVPQGVGNV